jgi:hypothetical protein
MRRESRTFFFFFLQTAEAVHNNQASQRVTPD